MFGERAELIFMHEIEMAATYMSRWKASNKPTKRCGLRPFSDRIY